MLYTGTSKIESGSMTEPPDKEKKEDMVAQNPIPLTDENMRAFFHIALVGSGGFQVPKKMLDNYPKDVPIKMVFDEVNEVWHVSAPMKKPKRGKIVKPNGKLFVPGNNRN